MWRSLLKSRKVDIYKLGEVDIKGRTRREQGTSESRRLPRPASRELRKDSIRRRRDRARLFVARAIIEAKDRLSGRDLTTQKTRRSILTVNVNPGPQFTMGKLTIEGLDVETEPHIRKMFGMKRGQPFNVEYPDYFLARLVADQVMDNLGNTRSSITPNPETKTVDVTLMLEGEKKPEPPSPDRYAPDRRSACYPCLGSVVATSEFSA